MESWERGVWRVLVPFDVLGTEIAPRRRSGRTFDVLAQERGVADGPGGGLKRLGEEAARRVAAIRHKCVEDFDSLAGRIELHVLAQRFPQS